MANRTLRVLLKKIYTDGSIDTIYLKSRASDVFLDGSSTDTLASIVTKVNGIQEGATAVSSNATNGYISINGTATQVYAHPNSGVTAGTYNSVTVNAAGHVTAGTSKSYLLSSSKVTFTTASTKANIVSNSDTIAVMLGKLAKWYTSFGSLAWLSSVGTSQLDTTLSTAYNQRVVTGTANTTASVTESREITAAGYVADARAVANLQTQINTINSSLNEKVAFGGPDVKGVTVQIPETGRKQVVWYTTDTPTNGYTLSFDDSGNIELQKFVNSVYSQLWSDNFSSIRTAISDACNVRIDYTTKYTLHTGPMAVGVYDFTMNKRGLVVACNIYATELGSTQETSNFYIKMLINGYVIGDSQSYVVRERGGSISAFVDVGDIVRLELFNHGTTNTDLLFFDYK